MRKDRHPRNRKLGTGKVGYFIAGVFIVISVSVWTIWYQASKPDLFRTNLAIVGTKNVRVVSISTDFTEAVSISLPTDTVIESIHGYGKYSLDSLLKLDILERGRGVIFIQSLSDALGVPIDGFLVDPDSTETQDDPYSLLRRILSYSSLPRLISHLGGSSLPVGEIISTTIKMPRLNPAKVQELDFTGTRYEDILPDESVRYVLDTNQADYTLGNNFYDIGLRRDDVSVHIYNTTDMPLLGQKAARLLNHVGISVLSVANSDEHNEQCQVLSAPIYKDSLTVAFMEKQFSCIFMEHNKEDGIDIIVKLGENNANRFLPVSAR